MSTTQLLGALLAIETLIMLGAVCFLVWKTRQ